MSYYNFIDFFFPTPTFIDFPCLQYAFIGYTIPNPNPPVQNQQIQLENQINNQEQENSKDQDYRILQQNLAKIHSDSSKHKKCHWTVEEDDLLQKLVEIQKMEWKQIPKHFIQRTQNMCYSRYRRILMCTRDRLWSKEQEDNVLRLVNKFGEKWKLISSKMPKFTPKQIRQRYLNCLRPTINRQEFNFDQDFTLCKYVIEHGKHWRQMEEILPGRSQGCIKGRFYGKLQKIIQQSMKNINI